MKEVTNNLFDNYIFIFMVCFYIGFMVVDAIKN